MKKNNIEKKLFTISKIDFENIPSKQDFDSKIDKQEGMGLSKNNLTDELKTKIIESVAFNKIVAGDGISISYNAETGVISISKDGATSITITEEEFQSARNYIFGGN